MSRTVPSSTTIGESTALIAELFDVASRVRERSYSPYSGYGVGAAIRTAAGDVFACCNVENAAFPEGVCAEGGAISMMVVGSAETPRITDVVTVTAGEAPGTPCGGCRQKIREFATVDTHVHAATTDGTVISMPLADLLPASFGPEDLR